MVLRPWLGSLFLTSNPMLDQLTQTAVTCEKMPLLCQAPINRRWKICATN